MPLDGLMYRHLVTELNNSLTNCRINKFIEVLDTSFLLNLRCRGENRKLLVSLMPNTKRICFTTNHYESLEINNPFFRFLKKQLEGAIILNLEQYKCDRILILNLICFNEFKDKVTRKLILEFTKNTNLIFADSAFLIIDALYKTTLESDRLIVKGSKYQFLENKKLDPFTATSFVQDFNKVYDGISNNLYHFLTNNPASLPSVLTVVKPSIFKINDKLDFYSYPLGEQVKEFSSLSLLLEAFYFDYDRLNQIKEETNNIAKTLNRNIKRLEQKIVKLDADLLKTDTYSAIKSEADLLYTYPHLKANLPTVTVFDYLNNKDITLTLDPKYTVLENANRLYKQASKIKKSRPYILEQLEIAKSDLFYYQDLLAQLVYLDVKDIADLKAELKIKQNNAKNKKQKPHLLEFHLRSGARVLVGRNNVQNNYLTHELARNSDLWFHVLNATGSHVILQNSAFSEEDIRLTAMIAAKYSSLKHSSSIPVTYTLKKYVKKMSGHKGSFVKYSNEKTIYIDIDEELLAGL